ncbi:NAD(P)-binding protein [Legionella clemsonensis]|uniref:Tryptophan halogenase n=1 Tax=Legionella clemsonensis TaxID=1867846 RepID=A0A222P684_9GAMM|nr:NAD(P)-binding protein [Legionella clemsonensis]ASQ47317.1 Tryptophan halogenase [Legionella clemsonensis]
MLRPKKHHIAIVGSGPIGLYAAILLKKRYGENIHVTVLDSRANSYERPGIIAKQAVQIINSSFQSKGIPEISVPDSRGEPANSVFIADLQRALLESAINHGVTLIQSSFAELEKNQIKTKEGETLSCDLLIDCSGESRAVARFTTQKFGEDSTFSIQTIAENPLKNHFIAYVHMDEENSKRCKILDLNSQDPLVYAKAMEDLREKHGWKEFAEPEMVVSKWTKEGEDARYCFYFEIPEKIAREDIKVQEAYLKDLLLLKTGQSIVFKREEGRLKFLPFDVDPKYVPNPVNTKNYAIPVVVCGDALMSPEYRFGTGVANGVRCAIELVDAIRVTPLELSIHAGQYNTAISQVIQSHLKEVTSSYQFKRNELANRDLLEAFSMYKKGFIKAKETGGEQLEDLEKIERGLISLADRLKKSADEKFRSAIEKKNKQQHFKSDMKEAELLYKSALEIYENYTPSHQSSSLLHAEKSKIYSNQAKVFFHTDRIEDAIEHAELALKIAVQYEVPTIIKNASLALENAYNKMLSDHKQNFPNDKWLEKIELNEKIANIATKYLEKDAKPYLEEIEKLRQKLKEAQEAIKKEVSTLKKETEMNDSPLDLGNLL